MKYSKDCRFQVSQGVMVETTGNDRSPKKVGRRKFLARAACATPFAFSITSCQSGETAERETNESTAIDFSRSFCHYEAYEADKSKIWVRMQIECRCEVFDRSTGESDEYLLTVRTQTGLRTDPLSDVEDPGYDFWFIFSKRHAYIRRTLASSYGDSSSRLPLEELENCDWHIHRVPAMPLASGSEIRQALRKWQPVVARTEFVSADGRHGYAIEYPVKWADGNPDDTFRVETGPVVLLDPEQARVGSIPELDDFSWVNLDYRSLEGVKIFIERPTPVLSGTLWQHPMRRSNPLTVEQRQMIETRLFEGWDPPIPVEALRRVFQRDHFSTVESRKAMTKLYALG